MVTSPLASENCQPVDQQLEIMLNSKFLNKKKGIYSLKIGQVKENKEYIFVNNMERRKRILQKRSALEISQHIQIKIQFAYDKGLMKQFGQYGQGKLYIKKRIQELFENIKWSLKKILKTMNIELILHKDILFINEELKINKTTLLNSRKYQLQEDIPIIILCKS